jgi:GH25 family lysozyme M1 (1,4-beta-N-acetylmuramidase)
MGYIADLSKWQGDVDFSKLKNQVEFVILRVQAGYTSIDSKYKEYVAGCKANNIPFGTYAYFKGVSIPDSIAEAKNALELTDPDSKFFVLDIEEKSNLDLVNTGQAFIDYLKNKGVQKVGLYSGESFFKNNNLGAIKCDFVWIANYGVNDGQKHTAPKVPCDLWQYTSVGHLDGIQSLVDLNVLTGSKPLGWFTGVQAASIPEPVHTAAAQIQGAVSKQGTVTVIATNLNLRTAPEANAHIIRTLNKGESYQFYAIQNGWYNLGGNQWAYGNNGAYLKEGSQPVYYVIKSGDNLTTIAKNNGTTVSQLQAWNNITNPNKIFPGQKIRVK